LGNLTNLEYLFLGSNQINGPILTTLGNLTNLKDLSLHSNQINGLIPSTLGNLTNLEVLSIQSNQINGPIPSTLSNLTNLKYLYLHFNQITGTIFSTLGDLTNLKRLSLHFNQITGPIPSTLVNLTNLKWLSLHCNQINGSIPPELGNLDSLKNLNLSHNFINREAPVELGFIDNLWSLDISYNNLTSNIPNSYISIQTVSLSYNSLTGPILTYFHWYDTLDTLNGNKYLCGDFMGFPHCHPTSNNSNVTKVKFFVPIAISLGFLVLGGFLLSRRMVKKTQFKLRKETKHGNLFSIWNYDGHIAYEDIIEATKDFDIKYCIGTDGYDSVYKAKLPGEKSDCLEETSVEGWEPNFWYEFQKQGKNC
jgi:hypothetical protein